MTVESKGWMLETGWCSVVEGSLSMCRSRFLPRNPTPKKHQVGKARIKDRTRFKGQKVRMEWLQIKTRLRSVSGKTDTFIEGQRSVWIPY